MQILAIEINNFRNLTGLRVAFAESCNFIVGENNLGKSNLLSLLNTLFTGRGFRYEDFKDPSQSIEIKITLRLAAIEIGHFQDLFDVDDYTKISLLAKQANHDEFLNFYHLETNTFIPSSAIKSINYIHYDSLRNPVNEINFDKGKGAGRFLRNIITQYLESQGTRDSDFMDTEKVTALLSSINQKISKIKSFHDFGITATSEDDLENLLSKVVVLKDSKGDLLSKAGYGVQFLILVSLSILEKLQAIRQQRGDRGIFEGEDGSKSISMIIGLDEPEIHLHPYMQRALIKYLSSIINNENSDFQILIKELFGIDKFIGQIIVVTHSPNILLNDYKQIIRLYTNQQATKIISGSEITLDAQLQKHLYLQFPFIKEAFFSRCVIFAEGDSEFASFPYFAQALSISFDDLGICVIQARGDAIPQLIQLTAKFGIKSVGITDKDKGTKTPTTVGHYQTNFRDFEEEIISLIDSRKESKLREVLTKFDSKGIKREMDAKALNKRAYDRYGIGSSPFISSLKLKDIDSEDIEGLKAFYLTWFSINKSYPLGMTIGELFTKNEVPSIYQTLIRKAKELAEA